MSSALKTVAIGAVLACSAAALGGCSSVGNALGFQKVTPDEFRVVAKAPLVVPPDYALRPPSPGEPRPQELQPESSARIALLGVREAATRSQGETLLADRAGAQKADPLIRYVMDDEFGSIAHKDKSFADRVMFWKKDKPATAVATKDTAGASSTPNPIDPVAEQAKIHSLTGDQDVVIARAPEKMKLKLPGL
jgi:hypothetical protein